MKTIWKFPIAIERNFNIEMPIGAEILWVDVDGTSQPCIWAMVTPDTKCEERYFEMFGTGHLIPTDMGVVRNYLGSFKLNSGEFIGHLFERIN